MRAADTHCERSCQSCIAADCNARGGAFSLNGISKLLANPFYCGLIRLRKTGETFKGVHEPLISATLFNRVQQVLSGKRLRRVLRHEFLFRRLIRCRPCGRALIGEAQKGPVYYRCQTKGCPTTTIRDNDAKTLAAADLRLTNARARLSRLTDALVDGLLDRAAFEERRATLLLEVAVLEEGAASGASAQVAWLSKILELLESVIPGYDL
jgi:site-specific DNA recombinase